MELNDLFFNTLPTLHDICTSKIITIIKMHLEAVAQY